MRCPQLWFAFKLYLWRIEKQQSHSFASSNVCCDLLSNCIFDVLKNNIDLDETLRCCVVICFQIVSLTYWKTTDRLKREFELELWFAFKLYLWRIEKQHRMLEAIEDLSCDLLSNCIFDVLKNNRFGHVHRTLQVVICFQIVSLTYWKTTESVCGGGRKLLWFAFKLYLWRIEKQPITSAPSCSGSCDLLSNCIFDVLKNNKGCISYLHPFVVICFQIVSLTYWKTTYTGLVPLPVMLWFAFKLYLWRIEKQPDRLKREFELGCDLLSNCIFDVLKNNLPRRKIGLRSLWFAFKLYLWRIEKQLDGYPNHLRHSCDLLSNCIFDVLKNNISFPWNKKKAVVICFQIVSLTYWKTTAEITVVHHVPLWFAFKLYLWRIEKQLVSLVMYREIRCDLLSNCIFDVLKNNRFGHVHRTLQSCDLLSNCIFDVLKNNIICVQRVRHWVVICFQIVSLTYWKTTPTLGQVRALLLWFAFKLYLWRIEKQQIDGRLCFQNSCDLLSNCIFDVLKNNIMNYE